MEELPEGEPTPFDSGGQGLDDEDRRPTDGANVTGSTRDAAPAKNVVLIMADQFNARCLGVEGHANAQTPRLDALAASGTRFTGAYVQNPICTPSRVSWLTSLYPHNHGYFGLAGPNPTWLPSAFAHFRAHGYVTGAVGKLHVPLGWLEPHLDYHREAFYYGDPFRTSDYGEYLRGAGRAADRDDYVLQEWAASGGVGQGLDARPSRLPYDQSVDHWTAAHAAYFLRERPKDRPFFLWVSIHRPHQVWTPSQEFWDLYPETKLSLPPNADDSLGDRPPHVQAQLAQRRGAWQWVFEPRDWHHGFRRALRGYLGCVTQTDHAVGEVLDALDALQLTDDTLVVFGADHGGFAGDHGIIEKAPGIGFEAVTRIPFIWSFPGVIPAGRVAEDLVESIDFLPTACSLAGVAPPAMCDGQDISPLLNGEGRPVRTAAFTENVWTKRMRTKRWSFVHYQREMFPAAQDAGADIGELYDLANDPWETRNLYSDAAHAAVVEVMRRQLLEWMIGTHHPVTVWPMGMGTGMVPSEVAAARPVLGEDHRVPPARLIDHVKRGGSVNYF